MLVYILTGLVVFLSLRNYEKLEVNSLNKKEKCLKIFYKYIAIIVCTIIFGLRDYNVGTDTKAYYQIFNWFGTDFVKRKLFVYETGFSFFNILINKLFGNFTIFLIIMGFILYHNIISSVCKLSERPSISMLCFFGLGSFAQSCNILRQYLAMSFCLVALVYLVKKNKIIPFIFFVFVGFLFHKSAIIFIIILPLKYLRFELKTIIFFMVASVAVIIGLPFLLKLFDAILGSTYSLYIRLSSNPFSIINIGVIAVMGVVLICIISQRMIVKKNTGNAKDYNFYANMFLMYLSFVIVSIFSIELVDRMAIYFLPSIFFIIPIILKSYKRYLSTFLINVLFVGFLCLTFLLFVVRGSYQILPYTFVDFI